MARDNVPKHFNSFVPMTTEKHEHALTEKALERLTEWGKNPNSYGGENIGFSVCRQGAPSDAFVALGDCTPFTPAGKRGILNGQPAADTGAPLVIFDDYNASSIPFLFSFDLNSGRVSLSGAFPNLPNDLHFTVEYLKEFTGAGGFNILFYSEKSSDNSGYILEIGRAHV